MKQHTTIRENVGPRGVFNPNYVPPRGTYWDPETGRGGMPAPPAPSPKEARDAKTFNDILIEEFDVARYLATNPGEARSVAEAVAGLQAQGKTARQAANEVLAVIREILPKPTVSREVWEAEQWALEQKANRQARGIVPDGGR